MRALGSRPIVAPEVVYTSAKQALKTLEGTKDGSAPENPYTRYMDLQYLIHDLVGIICNQEEIVRALTFS